MSSAGIHATEKLSDHVSIAVPGSTINCTDNCLKEGRYFSRMSTSTISSVSFIKRIGARPRRMTVVSWSPAQSPNAMRSASTGRAVTQGSSEITTAIRFDIGKSGEVKEYYVKARNRSQPSIIPDKTTSPDKETLESIMTVGIPCCWQPYAQTDVLTPASMSPRKRGSVAVFTPSSMR